MPGDTAATARIRPREVSIRSPLIVTIVSPGRTPARAPGLVRSTLAMFTPSSRSSDRNAEPAALDWPLASSWLTIGMTSSLGMAKPMPTEPPVGDTIAELIADHLAVHIEDRPAGVAGIDRRIELQKVVERPGTQVAALGPR